MSLRFTYAVFEKDKAWLIPSNLSGIVEVDLNSSRSRLVTRMDGYGLFDGITHGPIQKLGDYIAIAPVMGEDFYLFNMKTDKLIKFSIAESIRKHRSLKKEEGKFSASFCSGENIYFVGDGYPGIAKINIHKKQIELIDIENDIHDIMGVSVGIWENQIFIPMRNRKEFLIFDMGKEQCKVQKIGNHCCIAACCDEKSLCLLPKENGNIEIYNIMKQKLRRQTNLPTGIKGEEMARWYCTAVYHNGYAWIFPFKSNMIFRLDLQTEETVCVKEFENISNIKYLGAGIYDENKIWGFYVNECRLDIIDCQTLSMESKYIYIPDNINEFIDKNDDFELYMRQNVQEEYISLEMLISYICEQKSQAIDSENVKCVGKDIWEELKENGKK